MQVHMQQMQADFAWIFFMCGISESMISPNVSLPGLVDVDTTLYYLV